MRRHWHRAIVRAGALLIALAALPAAVFPEHIPVLGYAAAKGADPKRLAVLQQGLRELGYVEGRNVVIDYRDAVLDGEYDALMADFVRDKVDIILAANAPAAVAAAKATTAIAIVMLAVNDPVGLGIVKSLERPDTNVTGTTMYAPQLIAQRINILKQLVPKLDKLAMVLNGNNANNAAQFEAVRSEAEGLGVEVLALDVRKPEDVAPAFDRAVAFGAEALVNGVDSFVNSQRAALGREAARTQLPFMFTDIEYVKAGGLMGLGPGHYEGYYEAAKYVDRILRGADPSALPVRGATRFTFSVNRSALNHLGLRLPAEVSAKVTDWID